MKTLLFIPSLFRKVANGTATGPEQIILFLMLLVAFIALLYAGGHHPYQAYYYSK